MEWVNLLEAAAYANWLSRRDGFPPCYELHDCRGAPADALRCQLTLVHPADPQACPGYRLPTEAEWEYAARAGTATATPLADLAEPGPAPDPALAPLSWYLANADWRTHSVAQLAPNAWGLFDLLGNVEEWCWDPWSVQATLPRIDPVGAGPEANRVVRGGNYRSQAGHCRSSQRSARDLWDHTSGLGFRLVRTVGEE